MLLYTSFEVFSFFPLKLDLVEELKDYFFFLFMFNLQTSCGGTISNILKERKEIFFKWIKQQLCTYNLILPIFLTK